MQYLAPFAFSIIIFLSAFVLDVSVWYALWRWAALVLFGHESLSKPEQSNESSTFGKGLRHHEHALFALCPRNPAAFLVAGISED